MGGNEPPPVPKPPRLEQDGTLELDGRRILPIRRSDARDFSAYLAARDKAADLGVELQIVGDDAFVQPVQPSGAVGEGVHISAEGNKVWTIPRNMLHDNRRYEAAKARASEQGMELLIVPDDKAA